MTKALVWLIFTYSVLKLGALVRAGAPGFRRVNVRWADRLRAGEPALFLAACMISMSLALLTSWYTNRTVGGLYEDSAACYGRIMALKDDPTLKDLPVYESVQGFEETAFAMGRALGKSPEAVKKTLAARMKYFADRFATSQGLGMQHEVLGQIDMARRCLNAFGAAPNE